MLVLKVFEEVAVLEDTKWSNALPPAVVHSSLETFGGGCAAARFHILKFSHLFFPDLILHIPPANFSRSEFIRSMRKNLPWIIITELILGILGWVRTFDHLLWILDVGRQRPVLFLDLDVFHLLVAELGHQPMQLFEDRLHQ